MRIWIVRILLWSIESHYIRSYCTSMVLLFQAWTADNNCQQYLTGVSGSVKSYNFDQLTADNANQLLVGTYDVSMQQKCLQRSAKRRGCLLSYSQAEPGRELTQPSPRLLAEPCILSKRTIEPTLRHESCKSDNCQGGKGRKYRGGWIFSSECGNEWEGNRHATYSKSVDLCADHLSNTPD